MKRANPEGARKRRFAGALIAGVIIFFILGLGCLEERIRGQIELSRFKQQLIQEGILDSPTGTARADPAALEAGRKILKLSAGLKSTTGLPEGEFPAMHILQSGRVIVSFRESQWVEYKRTNHWADVAQQLQAKQNLMESLASICAHSDIRNEIDFKQPGNLPLNQLVGSRNMCRCFGASVRLNLHNGDSAAAARDLVAELSSLKILEHDHFMITDLVRAAEGIQAFADTWNAMQFETWSDADLQAIQEAWGRTAFVANLADALKGEMRFADGVFDSARRSQQSAKEILGQGDGWFGGPGYGEEDEADRSWILPSFVRRGARGLGRWFQGAVYSRIWRWIWLDQAELRNLRLLHQLMELADRQANEHSSSGIRKDFDRVVARSKPRGLYDHLRFITDSDLSMARIFSKINRSEVARALAQTAIALKRYQLVNGSLPEKLGDLVPKFLNSISLDPMDGKPLRYQRTDERHYLLYSVGENFADDRGSNQAVTVADGSRSTSMWNKMDTVFPDPATPEEVEAFRRDSWRR